MNGRPTSTLDQLVERARRAEPPSLPELEARRMVRAAAERALAPRMTRARRAWFAAACAAVLVAVPFALVRWRPDASVEVGVGDRALRLALKTGDAVIAAPGAQLEVLSQEAPRRRVRVARGGALFDVRSLGAGQRFEVETEHASVRVLGTLFSVEVAHGRTIVRVYEGRVHVDGRRFGAGEVWVSRGDPPDAASAALGSEARAVLAERGLHAPDPSARGGTRSPVVVSMEGTPAVSAVPPAPARGSSTTGASWDDPADGGVEDAGELARGDEAGEPAGAGGLAQARAWLLAGESERALAAAAAGAANGDAAWLLLQADALRALGRFPAAVEAYERLAEREPGARRIEAGYGASALALHAQADAAHALALLDRFALDADDSPLRERASVLRVDALLALNRREQAKEAARRYLAREPETVVSRRLRALLFAP